MDRPPGDWAVFILHKFAKQIRVSTLSCLGVNGLGIDRILAIRLPL